MSFTKPEVHNVSHIRGDRATATVNNSQKFGEVWSCDVWDMRADRRADRQTDRQTGKSHAHHNT